jgi:hypothetical protein
MAVVKLTKKEKSETKSKDKSKCSDKDLKRKVDRIIKYINKQVEIVNIGGDPFKNELKDI